LSRGIVNHNGGPGPNSKLAEQFSVNRPFPSGTKYFISVSAANKTAYATLPTPQLRMPQ